MRLLTTMPANLRRHARSERGMAVPIVMFAIVAALGLAGAAIVASTTSQGGAVRDQNTKAALGAAEAGVADALVRFNAAPPASTADVCGAVGATGVPMGQWCPTAVSGAIDRGQYVYRVAAAPTELQVVSTGIVDGTQRRIEVRAHSAPERPFGSFSVIGLDHITQHSNSVINANVATNGNITLDANAQLNCNEAQVGEGWTASPTIGCHPPDEGFLKLAPVNQGDVATNNDNGRITLAKNGQPGGDSVSGNRNRLDWDPAARTLTLNSNVSLTLGGANYSLCRLKLDSNTNLFVLAGASVRIYFDSPENCGQPSGTTQMEMLSNSSIEATGSGPGNLALLFVGSEALQTKAILASNTLAPGPCAHSFVVYAPRTDIELASNSHLCGAIAGKSITAASNATVTTSDLASGFELPNTPPHYSTEHPGTFIECSAATPPAASPDEGC